LFNPFKKAKNAQYKCEICGEIHIDFPALAYPEPDSYYWLSPEEKETLKIHLDSDFCTIEYPDETEYFIRVVLKQKITDSDLTLDYGLWVSLSKKSYEDYVLNYDNKNHETIYFGWLSTKIPNYNFEESIPTDVKTKIGSERLEIFPHSSFDHPFVSDYYDGISMKEAEKRVHNMLSNIAK
jgi:hypothetical protein